MEQSQIPTPKHFPIGRRELVFAVILLLFAVLMANSVLYGGLNLGFSVASMGVTITIFFYLIHSGCKPSRSSMLLLALTLVLDASFVRSDDTLIEFLALGLVSFSGCLSLFRIAKQLPSDTEGKHHPSPTMILCIYLATTVICVLFPLVGYASSVNIEFGDTIRYISFTILIALVAWHDMGVLYAFYALLALFVGILLSARFSRKSPSEHKPTIISIIVNIVLTILCIGYISILLQNSFSEYWNVFCGVVPPDQEIHEVGPAFAIMLIFCPLCITILAFSISITKDKDGKIPLLTRLLCLVISVISLWIAAYTLARVGIYIHAYGLTRARLLGQICSASFGIVILCGCIRLFAPKFSFAKATLFSALIICSLIAWADVDTLVAAYNVTAYEAGLLQTSRWEYWRKLGNGIVPYLNQMANSTDGIIQQILDRITWSGDLRSWNIADALAKIIQEQY